MPKTTGPIRIISDGSSQNTQVIIADGRVIENVTSVTIWLAANETPTADLTILAPIVDVKTVPGTTSLFCPICEDEHDHDCKPNTIGGL